MQQFQLFPYEELTAEDRRRLLGEIRGAYWFIRNLRGGRFGQAPRRKHYRKVAAIKKRLQLAGVPKREILDYLKCCRLQCTGKKQPFQPCPYCL